jgi:16S rRNA (adenine1518-N6/adenine1519-N6)-dimethyltransferase
MNPDSPSDIRALLEERGLALKKRWGQNFLVNRGARERLIACLAPQQGERIWEIGPGLGSMTRALLEAAGTLVAFEVDRGLCRYLEESLGTAPGFLLVQGDFLDTWGRESAEHGPPARILGNLPYSSASMMIAELIEKGLRPTTMVFTVQRELAERIASAPGEKSYSSFSVLCQCSFSVAVRGNLQPGSFYPVPDVVSSIVEMKPLPGAPEGAVLETLSLVTRSFFGSRRKTIRNNIMSDRLGEGLPPERVLAAAEDAGIDVTLRAEQIPPEGFIRLAKLLRSPAGS